MPEEREAGELEGLEEVAELLAAIGPWILLIGGLALDVAAFVFRSYPDVAAPSIVFGSSMVIASTISSRIEGSFEVGPHGVRARVHRLIRRQAKRDTSLPLSKKLDVIRLASEDIAPNALSNVPTRDEWAVIARDSYAQARSEAMAFEARVRKWLEDDGWMVETPARAGPDLIARKDRAIMLVETKLSRRPIPYHWMTRYIAQLLSWRNSWTAEGRLPALALFVSAPDLTSPARQAAREAGVDVYVDGSSGFQRIDPDSA